MFYSLFDRSVYLCCGDLVLYVVLEIGADDAGLGLIIDRYKEVGDFIPPTLSGEVCEDCLPFLDL